MESTFKAKISDFWVDNQKDLILVGGIALIALISFGSGYLLAQKQTPTLAIEEPKNTPALVANVGNLLSQPTTNTNQKGMFVASKNGKYYYWPWSSGVKNIKETNKVWFSSETDARKAGLKPEAKFKQNAPADYHPLP